MSGHNPHSHLSQPNSSWNPLQIPSYIPRQPQVAHMSSNERSLVRSPLTWHTPTPPEALYSFISAKHKNLELNPLLPSFVRGPPPTFSGSVDLTIQSSRNNSTSSATSPRNLSSPSSPDFTAMHNKHNVITNNLQSSGVGLGPGVIQTTGSVRDKFSASNGSNCSDLSSTGSGGGGGGGSGGGGLYIRDARQINNDLLKMSAAAVAAARDSNEVSSMMNEQPVELVNQTAKLHVVPTSPRRLSPPRTSSLLNHTPASPESTSPVPLSMNVGVGINLDLATNNHISPLPLHQQQQQHHQQQQQHQQQQITSATVSSTVGAEPMSQYENSPLCSAAPSPLNATSNDDSVDSNTSKTRRRRKPNRIIRVPNDSDDSLPANDVGITKGGGNVSSTKAYHKELNDGGCGSSGNGGGGDNNSTSGISDKNENCLKLNNDKFQTSVDKNTIEDKIENNNVAATLEQQHQQQQHHHHHHHYQQHHHQLHRQQQMRIDSERLLENERIENRKNDSDNSGSDGCDGNGNSGVSGGEWTITSKSVPLSIINQETENNKMKSVIVDNISAAVSNRTISNDNLESHHRHHQNRLENHKSNTEIEVSKCKIKTPTTTAAIEEDDDEDDDNENTTTKISSQQNCCVRNNSEKRNNNNKQKGDSDDIETIDKIAAMIASSNDNEEEPMEVDCDGINNLAQREAQIRKSNGDEEELEQNSSKLTDLTEILCTPITTSTTITNSVNSCVANGSSSSSKNIDTNHLPSQENSENVKEIRFEEVEDKLEEMFAGIEDERPCNISNAVSGTVNEDQNDPTIELEQPLQQLNELNKDEPSTSSGISATTPPSSAIKERKNNNVPSTSKTSTSQKKTTSVKQQQQQQQQDSTPPKKKRRTTGATSKKTSASSSNQKTGKQKSSTTKSQQNEKGSKDKCAKEKYSQSQQHHHDDSGAGSMSGSDNKYKGPFVQIKSDGSLNIVNAPIAEDDSDKQSKVKKTLQNHHTNSERSKIRGLHVSTLSVKYDADTIDTTWMCVFCKKGPHRNGLGDLFGPYILTTECEEFELSQKNPSEDEFVSKRTKAQMVQKACNLPVVAATLAQKHQQQLLQQQQPSTSGSTNTKKKKRGGGGGGGGGGALTTSTAIDTSLNAQKNTSLSSNNNIDDPITSTSASALALMSISSSSLSSMSDNKDIFYGMSKVSDTLYEIWTHEDCAVWASGVYMIGSRIIGLESAVWSSTRYKCNICSLNGAMICCLQRGCSSKAHISCARHKNWQLMEFDFKTYCERHHFAIEGTSKMVTGGGLTSIIS